MEKRTNSLVDQFIVSPYSVLDARTALWQKRKREWREKIGFSGETREGTLFKSAAMRMPDLYQSSAEERKSAGQSFEEYAQGIQTEKDTYSDGVSTFDPVLAEIIYHWFTPGRGSKIFDPFAGGVTKGAVASMCGHCFTGIEVREEQVAVNHEKARENGWNAHYICDDALNALSRVGFATQDLLISCPPYYNREMYSDLPNDVSNMSTIYEYLSHMNHSLMDSMKTLKENRFAVIVVSDVRDEKGAYINLPEKITHMMNNAKAVLWNELILINADASAKLRARGYMKTRKVVRTHQKVLVFYKGRTSAISKHFPNIQAK